MPDSKSIRWLFSSGSNIIVLFICLAISPINKSEGISSNTLHVVHRIYYMYIHVVHRLIQTYYSFIIYKYKDVFGHVS